LINIQFWQAFLGTILSTHRNESSERVKTTFKVYLAMDFALFYSLAFLLAFAAICKGLKIYAPWAAGVALRRMVSYGLATVEIKLTLGTETEVCNEV